MSTNESNLDVNIRGKDGLTPALNQIESKLIRFVGAVSSALTAIRVVGFPVNAIRQFEKQMANVQKTTDFTDGQIRSLSESLVDMSRKINVSANDLGAIAAAAGQQGLGREGVEGIRQFTETVSRMAAVLDLTAEEAGTNVGKIASIFKVSLRDIESVSSAFNQTSNKSTASGEQLLDVVKRIGNAAGALNLEQAIGLAATGIDLGQSPEVVGTSFAKIFAEMFAQADEFAKLLKMPVDDYLEFLQKDGIGAYKKYLEALRGLNVRDQQKTIKRLSGGGRIGVVVTKGVQDSDNALLDENLRNAKEGKTTGTSAIKEQLTVLSTLDAEITKAGNSFQALGIIAGEVFGPRLTGYFAELNSALANPAVISFAKSVGEAFLGLFDTIATGIKWISALNVNWENFVTVVKVVLELKLAQWLLSSLSTVPLLGGALTKLGLDAVKAGEQQAAGSAAANSALKNQILRIKELIAQREAHKVAVAAEAQAEIAASKAVAAQREAETRNLAAQNKLKRANGSLFAAGQAVTGAKSGVSAAEKSAASRTAAVRAQLNAKLQAAEARHEERLAAIAAEGAKARGLARTLGDTKSAKLASQLQAQAEAQEKVFQARSLTSLNAYYAKRIAAAQAAGLAEVGASKLALMQSLGKFDQVAGSAGFGVLTAQARNTQIALNQADAAVNATNAALAASRAATTAASTGWTVLGNAIRIAGTAFQVFLTIAARVFFWVTIIYTALDAFGALDNLGGVFEGITDWLGLTSEASRKLAQARTDEAEAHDKATRAMQESIKVLDKFIDTSTGLISKGTLGRLTLTLGDEDPNVQKKAFDDLISMVEGAYAKLDNLRQAGGAVPGMAEKTKAELDQTKKEIADGEARIAELQRSLRNRGSSRFGGAVENAEIVGTQKRLETLRKSAGLLSEQVSKLGTNAITANDRALSKAHQNLNELQALVQRTFTAESAEAFVKFVPDYVKAVEEKKKAETNLAKAQEEYSQSIGKADEEQKKAAVDTAVTLLTTSNSVIAQVQEALGAYIAKIKEQGNLSDAIVGSLDRLPQLLNNSIPQLNSLLRVLGNIKATGEGFSGDLAPPKANPKSGDGSFTVGGDKGNGEARALAKARLELLRAGLEAEANIQKQAVTESQDALEHANSRALVSIKNYYAEKLRLARENNAIEQRLKQNEIEAFTKEMADKSQPQSSRVRLEGQIVKAEGELKVLQAQSRALADTNSREETDALREFTDSLADQRNSLVEFFGATNDNEAFQASLDASSAAYRDFVQRLRVEAEGQPELLKLADAVELQGKFQAVEASLNSISREAALTTGQFDLLDQRIAMLLENGTISQVDASGAYADIRRQVIAVKEAELARAEAQLAQLYDSNKALEDQSLKYKELALSIAQSKQSLDTLKTKANDTAKQINENISASIKGLFMDIIQPGADVQEVLNNFAMNVVNSIADVAAQGLTDMIMNSMGGMAGGIGGFFSSLFGGAGQATQGTELNPMVTREWSGDKLLGGATKSGEEALPGLLEQGWTTLSNGVSDLGTTLMGGLSGVTGGISGALDQGWQLLMGFLGPLFSSLIAVFTGAQTAEAAQGLISAVGSAAAAHGGGIAGHFTMKKSGIGILAPTVAYHTGGLVGAAPDEVSALLKKGEEVLTEQDPRHRNNIGKTKDNGESEGRNIRVVPVLDPSTIHDAINSAQGEETIIAVMKRRASVIRQFIK